LNAASFGAVIANALALPPAPPPAMAGHGGVRAAFRYARTHPGVRRLLVGMSGFTAFAAPLQLLMPALPKAAGGRARELGLLVACFGSGALAGAWVLGVRLADASRARLIPLSALGFAAALAGASVSPSRAPLAASTALAGAFWMWTFASTGTALQLLVEDA